MKELAIVFCVVAIAVLSSFVPRGMTKTFEGIERRIAADKTEFERVRRIETNSRLVREGLMDAH